MHISLRRRNQVKVFAETQRPPNFRPILTRTDKLRGTIRRFFDLQAGSIWSDLREILPTVRGVVLDVGCGAQPYRTLLPPDAAYQGCDSASAPQHFGYCMPDTTYFDGDYWPVPGESVDLVLSTETLEHVPNSASFLAEAYRCLKPGGQLGRPEENELPTSQSLWDDSDVIFW
jgi:SAM-dependent methyltransferase